MNKNIYGYIDNDINLAIGEKTRYKLGIVNTVALIYSGMVSKDVFSIVIQMGSGYQGYSYNLYYPKETKSIKIGKESITVVNVTPERLTLRR